MLSVNTLEVVLCPNRKANRHFQIIWKVILLILIALLPSELLTAQNTNQIILVFSFQNQQRPLYLMQPDGSDLHVFDPFHFSDRRFIVDATLSPDGTMLAFVDLVDFVSGEREGHGEVSILDLRDGSITSLTSYGQSQSGNPTWSPDGQHLAFRTDDDQGFQSLKIYDVASHTITTLVENNQIKLVDESSMHNYGSILKVNWSSDGQQLVMYLQLPDDPEAQQPPINRLITMNSDGTNARLITPDDKDVSDPVWSSNLNIIYMACTNQYHDDICSINLQTSVIQMILNTQDNSITNNPDEDISLIGLNSNDEIVFQIGQSTYRFDPVSGNVVKIIETTDDLQVLGVFTMPITEQTTSSH